MPLQDIIDLLAAFYQAEVMSRNRDFIFDENIEDVIIQVAEYIVNPRSEFGIIFYGMPGNGKTTMVLTLQKFINYVGARGYFDYMKKENSYFKYGLTLLDSNQIVRKYREDLAWYDELRFRDQLAIDDLGKEPTDVMIFGNICQPVIDLIDYRYRRQLFTVVTSNLTGPEIRAKYGDRIADRFNEMLHTVAFHGETYRRNIQESI